uniref:SANT domain-containing protein n=1 Tax=Davidia involucrata TaxID=16924 RepID=A0A5B6ZQA5_DAVIN
MEMDLVQPNHNGDCIKDTSAEQLLSPDCFDAYDIFGEPGVLPRVGDQYQVEIPPLIMKSDYLSYMKNPTDAEIMAGVPRDFLMGLAIPVMWIMKEIENMKHDGVEFLGGSNDESNKNEPLESETIKEAQINLNDENSKLKVEPLDTALDCGMELGESPNLDLEQEMEKGTHQKYRGPGNYLLPGSFGDSWSDIEEERFLLGLYIFGKNLIQVKRFIESKKMGDILSFYYGKFYRSDGYRKWSDCRKMRSRRCVYGQKIFTGLRQQEFLSRLLPRASEECQITLLEVSKTYGEGKMSLEEYIFTLKAIVGMESLVEAVGIGRGKQDLTGIAMEPLKSNHVIRMRPEIPIGKACSLLTPREIIEFLTGDFRLSKARSNDLFWEAVWPRLLARGWHSEQPKNQVYAAGFKHSLVFLMPGVKKFVRRRLVKGNHYFDSVSDVLNKVASDPGLLELDIEADDGNRSKEEYGWTSEAKLEQNDLSDQQRHCYLQPRTPNRNTDLMKFTVVDTSLADGKTYKVRELRTLLVDVSEKITSGIHSEESDRDTNEVSTDESDSADIMLFDQRETANSKPTKRITDMGMFSDGKDFEISVSNQGIPIKGPDSTNAPSRYSKDHNILREEKQPRKAVKCRLRHESLNYLASVTKRRRRLTACSRAETSHGTINFSEGPRLEQEKRSCCSDTLDSSENSLSQMGSSPKKVSSTSSSKGSPTESRGGIFCDTTFGAEHPYEKPQPRTLIDLNLPHVPPDFETGEACMMELREGQGDQTRKQQDNSAAVETSVGVASSEQQPNMNSRRQSTRNRPPTVRALEALASGFLTINRRRKSKETGLRENSTSRPPRRARYGIGITESFSTGTVASKVEKGGNDVCNGNNDMFSKFQLLSEGNGTQVSGP